MKVEEKFRIIFNLGKELFHFSLIDFVPYHAKQHDVADEDDNGLQILISIFSFLFSLWLSQDRKHKHRLYRISAMFLQARLQWIEM